MLDVDMSEDNFVNTIDDDSLWVPHNTNHPTWVTQLVCQLIRSRGVHDELLCLLAPVCQVKVSVKVIIALVYSEYRILVFFATMLSIIIIVYSLIIVYS